jgi:hypothetical protein
MKKKIVTILAALTILLGIGVTVGVKKANKIPIGGASQVAEIPVGGTSAVAYIPVGGTSATLGSYTIDSNSTDTGVMIPASIPVGGT